MAFPAIPGVQTPKTLTAGSRAGNPFVPGGAGEGAPLPLLVPQVDADGNERIGNQAARSRGPARDLYRLELPKCGDRAALASSCRCWGRISLWRAPKAEREARHDPRPSIEERYASRQQYLDAINKSAAALVKEGYLLAGGCAERGQTGDRPLGVRDP